jgi:dipeptidyl aminopeptidase/acylaminoacyl peptidase
MAGLGLALTACIPLDTTEPPPTPTVIVPSPTPIPAFTPTPVAPPTAVATLAPSPTPIPTPASQPQLIAYVREGTLLVTDVTGGVPGATMEHSYPGLGGFADEVTWSPNGTRLAFSGQINNETHIIYVSPQNVGGGLVDDLGPGTRPAWAPDNTTLAFVRGFPDENIWTINVETREAKQLTFETNYAWGNPVFTPDGQALIVTGADRNNMGAQGNTTFTLERLALDGSGTRAPLAGATPFEGGRLPYDLRFSPDGTRLAFSSSYHLSACASPGAYYVSNADGSNRQELISPSLAAAIDPAKEYYHVGLSYAWSPGGDALAAFGNVVNCDFNSPDTGKSVAGPQLSILGLDGSERLVIPGMLFGISVDRTGTLIGAAHYQDIQDTAPVVEIYSAQTGQLVLSVGPGSDPQFQP